MIRTDYRASSYAINITTASFKNQTVSALTPTPTVTIAASKNMMSGQSTASVNVFYNVFVDFQK